MTVFTLTPDNTDDRPANSKDVTELLERLFQNEQSLQSVVMAKSVKSIHEYTFSLVPQPQIS